jgi:hypothetical protein
MGQGKRLDEQRKEEKSKLEMRNTEGFRFLQILKILRASRIK